MDINRFNFENLNVYKRSLKFCIQLCKIAINFAPKYRRLSDQLIGASSSIPLNIAEGSGSFSQKERINFYKIARSSIFECVAILQISSELDLISKQMSEDFIKEAADLSKMLSGLIKSQRLETSN